MRARAILTTIWIGSFFLAVLIAEAYFIRTTSAGVPLLLPSDRVAVYKMLGLIYGGNIGAILASWYVKPFQLNKRPALARFMTLLAVTVTITYNSILLYLIGQGHLDQAEPIDAILDRVKTIGGILAFLTVPINTYYFGATSEG